MKQPGGTLFCAWCLFVTCVSAGRGGAGPGQDTITASEDVSLAGDADVTGQTTTRDVVKPSYTASFDKTVTPSSNLNVQVAHETVFTHPAQGKKGHDVSESWLLGTTRSTTKTTPQPDVTLEHVVGLLGQGTSQHPDKAVQLNESVPDNPKDELSSITASAPSSGDAFIEDALENESQSITKPPQVVWHPSTASVLHSRTESSDAEHEKRKDAGLGMQMGTEGLCDTSHGMSLGAPDNK